jgi:hypothetical protein
MIGRILGISGYLFRSFLLSLAGLLYILLTLAFYIIFFDPRQRTPDSDYFVLVLGIFGLGLSFLVTISVAARANKAVHFPLLVRLESRIEYLTSVFLAAFGFSIAIQLLVGISALLINGPTLTIVELLTIPLTWIAGNILFITLALHATDLVTRDWSRVYVFAALGLLLYLNSELDLISGWISSLLNSLGRTLISAGLTEIGSALFDVASWLSQEEPTIIDQIVSVIFWPFNAISDAYISGGFTLLQALAPAILLVYATALFLLASKFFARKDLFLTE